MGETRKLNRDAVIDAALTVLDRTGIEGLRVKLVAEVLDIPQTTLYSYFSSKDELLNLLYGRVATDFFREAAEAEPEQALQYFSDAVGRTLAAHPQRALLLLRPAPPLESAEREKFLALLLGLGMRMEEAWSAISTIILASVGFSLIEVSTNALARGVSVDERLSVAREKLTRVRDSLPYTTGALETVRRPALAEARETVLDCLLAHFGSRRPFSARPRE